LSRRRLDAPGHCAPLTRCRWAIGIFIVGLVLSGVTAFPLAAEMEWLGALVSPGGALQAMTPPGLQRWILTVRDGLADTYQRYPWIGYGTDWLAFGHIVIALFFVEPWRDPVRNAWVLRVGIVACVLVVPLALLAGPVRGIPFYWRLIDCSFGVIGVLPLLYALRCVRQMGVRSGR
jgi:hypothetical protein